MDTQRNRESLGKLRQVAEDILKDSNQSIEVGTTNCLGVCKPGHVMGFADPEEGVYIFNEMDDEESVRSLAETVREGLTTGKYELSTSLRQKMEGQLPAGSVEKLPWQQENF